MGKKILFIHHSTGANLIREGHVRDEIARLDPSIGLWDHSYNLYPLLPLPLAPCTYHTGLTDAKGIYTGTDYNIVLSNNSPKEYAEIFSRDPKDFTLHSILQYDVIAFKNCYPTTKITSDKQLEEDRVYYQNIRKSLQNYPKKHFVLLTPPPERKETTTIENAARAKKLVEWLCSKEFVNGASNLSVFDFFSYLADEQGFLQKEYTRLIPLDSHPNSKANRDVTPFFAKKLVEISNAT